MIIDAFAAGDVEALRGLLAPEPLANFTRAIEARASGGAQDGRHAGVDRQGRDRRRRRARTATALVAVKFAAKMNSATTDAAGAVVDGSPTEVADHVEVWTFTRAARPRAIRTGC